ncbi:hypothetical protein P3X46_031865 [Hevea brasiliensis]|uniref:Zinc finger PHD-type domain-containing protein n=1 Tax=Hevea brasiliensis TaxID=3981 RepID=A0ABQ9KNN7_HEVBR|nr:hypothetical protein P3X46_031865 [Hevea brasiliensis]
MWLKCYECSHIGSIGVAPIIEGKKNIDYSCPLSFVTSSCLSTDNTMFKSFVPNFAYRRRKLQGNSIAIFSTWAPTSTKKSGEDYLFVVSFDAPILVKEQHVVSQDEHVIGMPVIPINRCSLPNRSHASTEDVSDSSASKNSWSCKIYANPESTLKMIICDNCEEAFYLSCYNPRIKRIPLDEWFCHSCSKKHCKILEETISRSPSMIGDNDRCENYSADKSNPITLMLRDTGSFTNGVQIGKGVRIGKGFQVDVPYWLGPSTNDEDTIGELWCKEVIDGAEESANGTICGKAPLFEFQTDDWECFCSILWDPIHADCAVPQELDTDQILKQPKYIQTLRPQLQAKWQKLNRTKKKDDSMDNGDVRNIRTKKMSK